MHLSGNTSTAAQQLMLFEHCALQVATSLVVVITLVSKRLMNVHGLPVYEYINIHIT